jgi:hypothetical protein
MSRTGINGTFVKPYRAFASKKKEGGEEEDEKLHPL